MNNHTPALDEARAIYASGTPAHHVTIGGSYAEFDRMIAKVRTEAKAEALREAAGALEEAACHEHGSAISPIDGVHWKATGRVMDWLRARADKLGTL